MLGWAFRTSWAPLLLLVAAVRNPTVRLRYLAARQVLAEHGLSDLHPELLSQLGCLDLPPDRAGRHLEELALTFDIAARVARTSFPSAPTSRRSPGPSRSMGPGSNIQRGNHREVVFCLVATYAPCHRILAIDAPALERERGPAFAAMLADLGIRSSAVCGRSRPEHLPGR